MEASVQAFSLKSFIKVLQCLAKFGDDLHLYASAYELQLSVVNQTKSAFCLATLESGFFSKYRLTKKTQRGGYGMGQAQDVKCQLLVKSLLAVLSKQANSQNVSMLEMKIVEGEEASTHRRRRYEDDEDELESIETRLILKLICKHGVVKTHTFLVGSSKFETVIVDADSTPSQYVVPSRLLREWLDHFPIQAVSNTEYELGWHYGREEVQVKTFAMGSASGGLQTSIGVGVDEFEEYFVDDTELRVGETEVGKGLKMNVPMKEFRAALTLSESFQVSLAARFSEATAPIVLNLEIENCRAEIIIATTRSQAFEPIQDRREKQRSEAPALVVAVPMKRKAATQSGPAATQTGRRLRLSSQAVIPESQLGGDPAQSQDEPLFMPGGSQQQYDEEAMERSRQSQKMALVEAGLDGFEESELLGMMENDNDNDKNMDMDFGMDDRMDDGFDLGVQAAAADVRYGSPSPIPEPPEPTAEPQQEQDARERSETAMDDDSPAIVANEDDAILDDDDDDDDEPMPPTARPRQNMFLIYQD